MQKFVGYFLVAMTFVVGVSVGSYLGIDRSMELPKVNDDKTNLIPVQDVVIRNIDEEKKENNEPIVIETLVEETKISPYAKLVIEKKFTKCGHSSVEIVDIPVELINMTEAEVMKKYSNWEIRSFNSKEVSLFREIASNCNDHFVLKEKDGLLAVYNNVTEDTLNLKELTDIDVTSLPSGDIESLQKGIFIYGQDELSKIMEDFE